MQQTEEALLVGAAALDRHLAAGLEQVLQHGAEKHCADQQQRGEQCATQGLLVVVTGADQVHRRHQHHQQDRPVPKPGKHPQRLLQGWMLEALGQRAVTDQMGHRTAQAYHQHTKNHCGKQAGKYRDTAGDITAQLTSDLRAGQRVAEGGKEADQEQRLGAVVSNNLHGGPLVPDVKHHNDAQQHRGRKDAAARGIGKTQRQRTAHRSGQEVAYIEGQRQADQRWNRVGHDVAEQALQALASCDERAAAGALHDPVPQ